MFNNRKELLGKLKSAPNPKELKEQFLEELQEGKEEILDFREELGQALKERSVIPDIEDPEFYKTQMKGIDVVTNQLEKISSHILNISSKFVYNSKKIQEYSSALRRFK